MSIYYDGSHSITFWELYNMFDESEHSEPIDSWEDLHLIPLTRPDVVVPEPNLRILQIPGTNKRIDITNKLPGKLTFGKRQGQWQFAINHEKYDSWVKSYNRLRSNLHGKRMMFRLNDDPSKIYCGEIVIVGYSPEASYTTVTIQYDLDKGFYNHSDAINPDIPIPSFPDNPSIYISIRFIGRTKNIIETQYKLYGESVTPPEPPEESGYRFRRWSPDIHAVTGNQDYYAQYDVVDNPSPEPGPGPTPATEVKYRFVYEDPTTHTVTVISSGKIAKGRKPTEPDASKLPVVEGKKFSKWVPTVAAINKDTDFYAIYIDKVASIPESLVITIRPVKTIYDSGEIIDYTGIKVTAVDRDGYKWESDDYPNGVIPFEELIFPMTIGVSDDWVMTNNGTILDQANTYLGRVNDRSFYKTKNGRAIAFFRAPDTDGWYSPILFSTEQDAVEYYYGNIKRGVEFSGVYGGVTWYVNGDHAYRNANYETTLPIIPSDYSHRPSESIAYLINYFGIRFRKTTVTVPVQWKRPMDDHIIEGSFEIVVGDYDG